MTIQDRRKLIHDQCRVYIDTPNRVVGGQHCGVQTYPTVIEHEELQIKLSIGYYRQNSKNAKFAHDLFDLILLELIN